MPSNKQKNNERAAKYQLAQEKRALDHLHNELSLAAQLLVKPQAHAGPALGGQNTTIAAISDPTWRPPTSGGDHACAPAVDLQPTWAAQPGRKCGGGGDDHSTAAAAADPEDPKRADMLGNLADSLYKWSGPHLMHHSASVPRELPPKVAACVWLRVYHSERRELLMTVVMCVRLRRVRGRV